MMQTNVIRRAGLRCAGRAIQARSMASLASFKTPAVFNEPNVCISCLDKQEFLLC